MKLITKKIETLLKKQGYTGSKKTNEIDVIFKLFNPTGHGTWYVYEHIEDDIYMAFVNLGDPQFAELGTISLDELKKLRLPFGLGIERDRGFSPRNLKEIMDIVQSGGHV